MLDNLYDKQRADYIRLTMPDPPIKAASEWQYVAYKCPDCGYQGECKCLIGEYLFCGKCGSEFLVKQRPK